MNKKRLGQHFLISKNAAIKIIKFANIQPDDFIIEIGPGKGALTSVLIDTGAFIIGVELDAYLCQRLTERYAGVSNIAVLNDDILKLSIQELRQKYEVHSHAIKLMGNIPFSISSPLIEVLINEHEHIREAVLMFQKEFADRLLAQPGSTSYGKLSVITELHFERKLGFNVKRTMFHPPPKVDASVVKLIPRMQFPIPVHQNEMNKFKEFLAYCFAYKRKTLINSLHASFAGMKLNADKNVLMKIIKELNFTSNIRAEQMNLEQFWQLFLALPHARNGTESR